MRKLFKIFPEKLYGQVLNEFTGEIGINVELIWNKTRNQNKFVREFAQSYSHEILHLLVGSILEDLYFVGEEKAVRKMLGEKWNNKLREYYRKHF